MEEEELVEEVGGQGRKGGGKGGRAFPRLPLTPACVFLFLSLGGGTWMFTA